MFSDGPDVEDEVVVDMRTDFDVDVLRSEGFADILNIS